MKRVVILQQYLMPYRVPLFNEIACHPDIDLTMVYYGSMEMRRTATVYPQKKFIEHQSHVLSYKGTYEQNCDFPIFLWRDLLKLKPDIIICAPDFGGLTTLAYAKSNAAQYIIWSEATALTEARRGYLKKPLRKLIYSQAWRFLVPGLLAEEYIRSFVPKAQVFFANNAIQFEDAFLISERELREKFNQNYLYITFSGSLIERKGLFLLLESFKKLLLQQPEIREKCSLRILGTGPIDIQDYQNDNIVVMGFCEGEKYINLIRSSHIFILPSLFDPNPLTVIEALFAGNVIVISDGVGSCPEVMKGNGIVIPAGSADEILKNLNYIVSLPPQTLTEMAFRSLSISKKFTTRRSANGLLEAIFS